MSARTWRRNGAACRKRGIFRIAASAGRVPSSAIHARFPRLRPHKNHDKKRRNMNLKGEVVIRGCPRPVPFFAAAGWRPEVGLAARLISQMAVHPRWFLRCWLHLQLHTETSVSQLAVLRVVGTHWTRGQPWLRSSYFLCDERFTSIRNPSDETTGKKKNTPGSACR